MVHGGGVTPPEVATRTPGRTNKKGANAEAVSPSILRSLSTASESERDLQMPRAEGAQR